MAINLKKGQRVDIGLQKIGIGLGWDPNETPSGEDFDLDASAFMLGLNGQILSEGFFVFYGSAKDTATNRPVSPDKAVLGAEDDRTGGSSDGDDETLEVDLSLIDSRVEEVIFTATIHDYKERRQNFGQVRNSFIRIYDATNNHEICKYELAEDFSVETAVEFGRLYKRGQSWRFEAVGAGYQGGLGAFVKKYAKAFN